jgi:tRNA pseudouridine55 synthase
MGMNKLLLVDKPKDWTSFDVVAKIRGVASKGKKKRIKVGHAGTLDPFATGLLIILLGEATRNQAKFMKLDKEYEATLKLGYCSTTGDPEGIIEKSTDDELKTIDKLQISKVLGKFIGEIIQIPPKYSAIKIDGQRAYKLARQGKDFEIKPRKVNIYNIEIQSFNYPELVLKVSCSSGTYIRTLAEDIGKALGTGAYLTALRRTVIGEYNVSDAKTIDSIIDKLKREQK